MTTSNCLHIRVHPTTFEALKDLAKAKKVPMSAIVRELLAGGLRKGVSMVVAHTAASAPHPKSPYDYSHLKEQPKDDDSDEYWAWVNASTNPAYKGP